MAVTRGGRRPYPRRQRGGFVRFLLMLAVLCAAALIVKSRVFVVREVSVEGNELRSDAEIVVRSGIELGQNIYSIDEKQVERNLSGDCYVKFIAMRLDLPDKVTLTVEEREARAAVNCAGVILLIDEEGVILERLSSMPSSDVIVVSGLDVQLSAQGRTIDSARAEQMKNMKDILSALETGELSAQISELNVNDRNNLYLVSRTGVQIILGDANNLSEKLVWAKAVLEKLTEEGVMSGVLDVSTGKNAVYADR